MISLLLATGGGRAKANCYSDYSYMDGNTAGLYGLVLLLLILNYKCVMYDIVPVPDLPT